MHNEVNYIQGEKTGFRMGENNRKLTTDKELITNIHNELLHLNSRKISDPIKKIGQRTKQTFLKEDIQMANKHMKRCSISLIIREMQMKTPMRYHLTTIRMAIKKSTNNKYWRGCREKGTLLRC